MTLLQYYPLSNHTASSDISISPRLIFKYSPTPGATVNVPVTATGAFGTPPYTYAWSSDDPSQITITNATAQTATYSYTGSPPASSLNSYGYVTVTDATSTSKTLTFPITFQVGGAII